MEDIRIRAEVINTTFISNLRQKLVHTRRQISQQLLSDFLSSKLKPLDMGRTTMHLHKIKLSHDQRRKGIRVLTWQLHVH